jgi:trimethylamine:corrinoid methyltransferase-like protein
MFNRDGLAKWESSGSKTLLQLATEKYHKLMANPKTYALEQDKIEAIEAVLKKAHDALAK